MASAAPPSSPPRASTVIPSPPSTPPSGASANSSAAGAARSNSLSTSSAPTIPVTGPSRHVRSGSVAASSSASSSAALMESHPELARCSHEVLVEMVSRQTRELANALENNDQVDEVKTQLMEERMIYAQDLEQARRRIDELLAEEARMETELAGRIEVLDKLRTTVRELEREKRDAEKRYREQADSFDSERQSWYDQEQHYKLRITNLSASNRRPRLSDRPSPPKSKEPPSERGSDDDSAPESTVSRPSRRSPSPRPLSRSSTAPTANELALQDQLQSLTTAHTSLTATLRALQVELGELKRVYQDLQEENESYEILLGEKTLNGQVQGSELFMTSSRWNEEGESSPRSLPPVGEEDGEDDKGEDSEGGDDEDSEEEVDVEKVLLETQGTGSPSSGAVLAGKTWRKPPVRKSMAGGGLDLAAELEAAQMADEEVHKPKRKKKKSNKDKEEELAIEIKQLREANKALTLYVSKIVDRVCSQEGFEKVLAVDYRLATPRPGSSSPVPPPPPARPRGPEEIRFRNSGSFFKTSNGIVASVGAPILSPREPNPLASSQGSNGDDKKGLSFGWQSVSSALGFSRPGPPLQASSASGANFKPLMLNAEGSSAPRKLETEEDEDDMRERERLRAEMALHGIQDSGNSWGSRAVSHASDSGRASSSSSLSPKQDDVSTPIQSGSFSATSPAVVQKFEALAAQENTAKSELAQGRASGFSEPSKPRRQRPGSRHSSRSSSSLGGSTVGLGISDLGRITPDGSPNLSSPATTASPEMRTDDADASWSKKLKRLSITSWTNAASTAA